MYQSTDLKNHIEQSSSINVQSLILAEWNLNFADNVKTVGNYRWRNGDASYGTIEPAYVDGELASSNSNKPKYYGALTSYSSPFRFTVADETALYYYKNDNQKEKILFSLTDCLGRFRPRSGINKIRYPIANETSYMTYPNESMHLFPRYYLPSKDDKFKYWSSYRTEASEVGGIAITRGMSEVSAGTGLGYYIQDANPFVVYNRPVPANRIVVKMQTNVTTVSDTISKVGNANGVSIDLANPFYENPDATITVNQTTPLKWYIEYLDSSNNWQIAKSFDKDSLRSNGKRIIGADGYVEIAYGLTNNEILTTYNNNFILMGEYASSLSLPTSPNTGDAYLIGGSSSVIGVIYVWNGSSWDSFVPSYGWILADEAVTGNTPRLTDFVSPKHYSGTNIYNKAYREFQFIYGIRIRVETMAKKYAKFDLIEMSPRLVSDVSDRAVSYSLNKVASDIGNTGMPVGQLLTSNGSIEIFDYDQAFNENNVNSILNMLNSEKTQIVSSFITKNLQFKFYEIIKNVPSGGNKYNYYVPIKTLYADGFPKINSSNRIVTVSLRNLYFYLESLVAPPMLHRNITLSMAVSILLDSVGFSNYKFDRINGNLNDKDDVIPFFFVGPDTSVAQVLNDLAVSTQTAIFFNEYNDLVLMSKNRILPASSTEKVTDIFLYGTKDFSVNGAIKNSTETNKQLSNIINIASKSNDVFNAGKITYVNRYIQKSILNLNQAYKLNNSKNYYYKPVLLWEASGTENTMANNDDSRNQSSFSLSAAVLNTTLSSSPPTVVAGKIQNNIIELSANAYLSRYNGYLYANSEIIKYDAIEYSIPFAQKTGLTGATTNGSNIIKMTSGKTTNSLSVGQIVSITSGSPGFTSTTISGIQSSNEFTISNNATSSTSITFSAGFSDSNVWITSLQEYQNYFSKLSYGGQIYPTGKVRIYTQPKYDTDGITPIGISKHGRAQFGTTASTHNAQIDTTVWSTTNIKNVFMDSTYIFNDPYFGTTVTYKSGTSGGTGNKTITVTESTASIKVGWYVSGGNVVSGTKVATIVSDTVFTIDKSPTGAFSAKILTISSSSTTISGVTQNSGKAGLNENTDNKATLSSVVRDRFSSKYIRETSLNSSFNTTTPPEGAVKSSALILTGSNNVSYRTQPLDYISYILKDFTNETEKNNFSHFGTRMRIVGQQAINKTYQTPVGSQPVKAKNGKIFSGASGGMCFRVDQTTNTNVGYYFEIAALTENSVVVSGETVNINNVYFYKIVKKTGSSNTDKAIPILLWSGLAAINVDAGDFATTQRLAKQTNVTSYDLAIETISVNSKEELFDLYINDTRIARVTDKNKIVENTNNNTIGMFTRGTSKIMFENLYALGLKTSTYGSVTNRTITPLSTIDNDQLFANGKFSKYGISSSISNTYLRGLSSADIPQASLWYDEFGTIMREAAYMNVRYDKAYPAITAKIAPTYNNFQSYAVAGFNANAYNAEFLVINVSDSMISLDESSSNYLRIYGVAPTQQSSTDLTVDEYFSKNSDFSNPALNEYGEIISPESSLKEYANIQNSRITYGKKEFTISGPYLQSESAAKKLMDWMVKKNMKKQSRLSVGIEIFANPMIQLGDIVQIDYIANANVKEFKINSRFVVYNIEYKRDSNGPSMTIFLSEVT